MAYNPYNTLYWACYDPYIHNGTKKWTFGEPFSYFSKPVVRLSVPPGFSKIKSDLSSSARPYNNKPPPIKIPDYFETFNCSQTCLSTPPTSSSTPRTCLSTPRTCLSTPPTSSSTPRTCLLTPPTLKKKVENFFDLENHKEDCLLEKKTRRRNKRKALSNKN